MQYLPRPGKRQSRIIKSIPSPIGGWNARDPIADMDERDAVILDDWFPTTSDVAVRNGWETHAIVSGQVQSTMPYNTPDGADLLFIAAGNKIYDATNDTAVGTAEVTGLTNSKFQYVNFTNSDGDTYLVAVNGDDLMLYYNGTDWLAISASSSSISVSGVSTSDLIGVMVHKRRLWFVEKDTLNAWYLPVNSVGGGARKFSLAGIASLGGYLMALNTWTLDAGQGPDDYWVAVTSEGEAIVYQGTDPTSITTWGLVGVWKIGAPLGRRCLSRFQGDLLIACVDGLLPFSKALISSRVNPRIALTDKISGAMNTATSLYRSNFGWEAIFLPRANMVLLNVPVESGDNQLQFVMNTITGAWARFTTIESNTWCIFNDEFYFGGNGYVGKFWESLDDDGNNINADLMTAFNYLGSRSELKRFVLGRPVISSDGNPSAQMTFNIDYDTTAPPSNISFTPSTQALWDAAIWDASVWGGGAQVFLDWQGVSGIGFCAAARILATTNGISNRLQSIDIVFEKGTFIT